MALPEVNNQYYPTVDEVHAQLLSDVRYGYARAGITVNVARGSELYIRMGTIASRVSIAINNNRLSLADISPLDASGDALDELAGIFGVTRRPASSAAGLIQIAVVGGGAVTIPLGYQCTSPDGVQYQTTQAYTVPSLAYVNVQAVSSGTETDQVGGTILTWDSAAIGQLVQNATVGAGGIDGGANEDDDEALRSRLLRRLGFPEVGGNYSQVIGFAEEASAAVERAFVYSAVRGAASYDVAITAEKGDRTLPVSTVNSVSSAVLSNMPGSADLNVTSVLAQPIDVVINATLSMPVNAGGTGGGWRNAQPWPSTNDKGAFQFAQITSVLAGVITVNSSGADTPQIGQSFGIWNPSGGVDGFGEMSEFTIASVAGFAGAYDLTTSPSIPSWVVAGMRCSAGAVNLKSYAATFLASMQALGPGQKTASIDILPRGRRQLSPEIEFPTDVTTLLLGDMLNSHSEILNLSYAARFSAGGFATVTGPSVPSTTADPPRILTLANLSIRAQL